MLQKSDVKIGMLFRFNKRLSIHDDVHGFIGVVLEKCHAHQYKTQVGHKTLWITPWCMEEL